MHHLILSAISFLLLGCISENESTEKYDSNNESESIPSLAIAEKIDINWIVPDLDTAFFSNRSLLYWQNNLDSAWLTFETPEGQKSILNIDHIGYWDRLGTLFRKEYDDYLFFIHRWISGCCAMPDFILLDKKTGKEIIHVVSDNAIFASEEEDFFLYFKDNSMNEMVYLDLVSNKNYRFDVRKFNLHETALDFQIVNSTEFDRFIDYPKFRHNKISIVFEHLPKNEKGEYRKDSIVFVINESRHLK